VGWSCRTDHRCWSTPDSIDGALADAASTPFDAAPDVGPDGCVCATGTMVNCTTSCGSTGSGPCTAACGPPTGPDCVAPAETCNGLDDDCDGAVDEAALAASPPVCAEGCAHDPKHHFPSIVGLGDGTFGVVLRDAMDGQLVYQRVAADGTPLGTMSRLGSFGVVQAAAFDGTDIVVAYVAASEPADLEVMGVSAAGARTWGPAPLPVPANRRLILTLRLIDVTHGRTTLYSPQFAITGGSGGVFLHRYRLDLSGATPVVVDHRDAVSDAITAYDVASAGNAEYVVYLATSGNLELASGGSRDLVLGGGFSDVGSIQTALEEPDLSTIAIAVRAPSDPISGANPLAIAWQRRGGHGTVLAFLASTGPPRPSTITALPGSRGVSAFVSFVTWRIAVTTDGGPSSPFYVASLEGDPADTGTDVSVLSVWEADLVTAPRALTLGGETSAVRQHVSTSISSGQIRIAEENGTGGIVTRAIGCF
jgi:hypothetical protein